MMYMCQYCGALFETATEYMKHEQVCEFITGGKKVYKKYSRKMEAEEVKVDPRVCNIKVYVNGKSAELQQKLFGCGCKWKDGTRDIQNTDFPFLYVNKNGIIQSGSWMDVFVDISNREENVDKVLEMTPVSEEDEACPFKAYDRVLGRDTEDQEWSIDLFVLMGEEPYKYECFRDSYNYCIPYLGNEHLAGKIN